MTCAPDPIQPVVDTCIELLRAAFSPDDVCLVGNGGTEVLHISGDGALPMWDGCADPFLWVRVARRYRSREGSFPHAYQGAIDVNNTAGVFPVVAVEFGVARKSTLEAVVDRKTIHAEALTGNDDSRRLEFVLSRLVRLLGRDRAIAIDTVEPIGPDGGLTAWQSIFYAQYDDENC